MTRTLKKVAINAETGPAVDFIINAKIISIFDSSWYKHLCAPLPRLLLYCLHVPCRRGNYCSHFERKELWIALLSPADQLWTVDLPSLQSCLNTEQCPVQWLLDYLVYASYTNIFKILDSPDWCVSSLFHSSAGSLWTNDQRGRSGEGRGWKIGPMPPPPLRSF